MDVSLKEALVRLRLLALLRRRNQYTLHSNAFDGGIGCATFQDVEDRSNHPFRYWSSTFNDTEQKLGRRYREYLVVICAVMLLCHFLRSLLRDSNLS